MAEQISYSPDLTGSTHETHAVQAILRFLRAVRYRKGVVIVAVTVSCLLGALYYSTTPRVYESKASLLVMQMGQDTWSTSMSGETRNHRDLMTTYCNVLTSEAVLENVTKLLPPEHRVDLRAAPREQWAKVLKQNLEASVLRGANILEIRYRSKVPETAAAVVNHTLTAYLAFMDKLHKSTARELLDILTKEKQSLEQQLRAKEEELLAVRRAAGDGVIRDGEKGINVVLKRAVDLNEALIQAHEKRLESQARLDAVERAIRNGEDLQQHALAMVSSVGREVLLNRLGLSLTDAQTLSRVNQQLLQDKGQLEAELQVYGPAHQRVLALQQRIRAVEDFIENRYLNGNTQTGRISNAELGRLLRGMAIQEVQQAVAHEQSIFASYEQEKQQAIGLDHTIAKLEILQLDLDRLRRFYDVVLQRVSDIDLGEESGMLRTSVLSRPEVPTGPIWPRRSMVAMMSLMIGIGLGLGIVYLQDLVDDHFRSAEDLQAQLGLPVLAMIRKLEPIEDTVGTGAIHAHVNSSAAESEAFRTLRTALALAEGETARLVVSSSEPGDGKTTLVVNLATVFAQSGKRTLLIDADMRRPGLTPLLNLKGEYGLSTVLRDAAPVNESLEANLYRSLLENLDVLPSGPRPINPTELLTSDRFSELLAWAETRYDQVLVDSPPALVSDTAIIGRLVDGLLLTVQPQKNGRKVVIRAAESFAQLGIKVIGLVVNRLATDKEGGYYGYDYGYGYGYSYGHEDEDVGGGEEDFVEEQDVASTIVRRVA